jgi:hypothetical protein
VHAPQQLSGLDAEILDEALPACAEDIQGLRLALGAVQGEHEQGRDPLVVRMRAHQRRERPHGLFMAPHVEPQFLQLQEGCESELLEPTDFGGDPPSPVHTAVGVASPELERLPQRLRGGLRRCPALASGPFDQVLEPDRVELFGGHLDPVARFSPEDAGGLAESPFQPVEVHLQRPLRTRRRGPGPGGVGEVLGADLPPGPGEQHGEQTTLHGRDGEPGPAVHDDVGRPEHLEFEIACHVLRRLLDAGVGTGTAARSRA